MHVANGGQLVIGVICSLAALVCLLTPGVLVKAQAQKRPAYVRKVARCAGVAFVVSAAST